MRNQVLLIAVLTGFSFLNESAAQEVLLSWGASSIRNQWIKEEAIVQDGNYSLSVNPPFVFDFHEIYLTHDNVNVMEGDSFRFSFYYNTNATCHLDIELMFPGASNPDIYGPRAGEDVDDQDFQLYTLKGKVPEGGASFRPYLYYEPDGFPDGGYT